MAVEELYLMCLLNKSVGNLIMNHENTRKKEDKVLSVRDELTEFIMYTTPDGNVKVEIFVHKETVWLNQDKIALLFGVQRPAITKHLKNIFESGELDKNSVSSILEHTATDGKNYKTKFYNLDAPEIKKRLKYI